MGTSHALQASAQYREDNEDLIFLEKGKKNYVICCVSQLFQIKTKISTDFAQFFEKY